MLDDMQRNVLIEPLWDWNYILSIMSWAAYKCFNRTIVGLKYPYGFHLYHLCFCFNRTIVGLKYITRKRRKFLCVFVLIEPLWDWNGKTNSIWDKWLKVLIEPLWDWNIAKSYTSGFSFIVLIEPLWDWNDISIK